MNKYIEDKSEIKYENLETSVLKNVISSNVSKHIRSYWKIIKKDLFIKKLNDFFS